MTTLERTGLLRTENKPQGSVLDMAASMDIDLLTQEQYRELRMLGACWRRATRLSRRQTSKYNWNSHGCGRSRTGSISLVRL